MMNTDSPTALLGVSQRERIATIALAIATLIVGASIVAGGSLSQMLNGLGGIVWFAASAMFILEGRKRGASGTQWLGVIALTAAVAFVVTPSDIVRATIGFVPAAFLVGMTMRRDPIFWAKLIPALYLPLHIGTAVAKAAGRSMLDMDASIRTEPPPTAAIVPAVMLVAALIGGVIASRLIARRTPQA